MVFNENQRFSQKNLQNGVFVKIGVFAKNMYLKNGVYAKTGVFAKIGVFCKNQRVFHEIRFSRM
jgi:hypothetical protein